MEKIEKPCFNSYRLRIQNCPDNCETRRRDAEDIRTWAREGKRDGLVSHVCTEPWETCPDGKLSGFYQWYMNLPRCPWCGGEFEKGEAQDA